MTRVGMKAGEAIESGMLTRQIERAQRRVEQHNFDARKQLLEIDDVANDQRRVIYSAAHRFDECGRRGRGRQGAFARKSSAQLVDQYVPGGWPPKNNGTCRAWARPSNAILVPCCRVAGWAKEEEAGDGAGLRSKILAALEDAYEQKTISVGPEVMRYIEKEVMLRTLDQHWREHLAAMDYMRQGIFLRSYAQKNPKQEYKREAFELFSAMLDRIKFDTVTTVSKIQVRSQAEIEREELERQQRLARGVANAARRGGFADFKPCPAPATSMAAARRLRPTMSWKWSRDRAAQPPRPSCARCPRLGRNGAMPLRLGPQV